MTTAAIQPRSFPLRERLRGRELTAVSIVVVLAVWHIASALAGEDGAHVHTVPNIVDIVKGFSHFADYWNGGFGVQGTSVLGHATFTAAVLGFFYNTGLTLYHGAAGVAIGILVSLSLAVAVSWSATLRGVFEAPGHFIRMLPLLAMAPLFALWFGDSAIDPVLYISFVAFALVFPLGLTAIGNVPGYYSQFASSLGASRLQIYRWVVLPAALLELRRGLAMAIGFSWSSAIATEYINQDYGLGHIVYNATFFGRTNVLALVALIALVLAGLSFLLVSKLLNWSTRWAE